MNTEVTLRMMELTDIDEVYELELASFSQPWDKKSFYNELSENKLARYLVLSCKGKIIGYVGIWLILFEGHITNIAIMPEYRRQGYGEILLNAILRLAKCYGLESITLEVRPSNTGACLLYEKMGFVCEGRRIDYYSLPKEDALILWLHNLDAIEIKEAECYTIFKRERGEDDECI